MSTIRFGQPSITVELGDKDRAFFWLEKAVDDAIILEYFPQYSSHPESKLKRFFLVLLHDSPHLFVFMQ